MSSRLNPPRTQKGIRHHHAKLTDAKVRAIRYLFWCKGLNQHCIAKLYGYKNQTIYDAVTYRTWKHVADTFTVEQIIRPEYKRPDMVV